MGINRSKTLQGKVERAEEKHHEQNAGRKGKETVDKSGNIYVNKRKNYKKKTEHFWKFQRKGHQIKEEKFMEI